MMKKILLLVILVSCGLYTQAQTVPPHDPNGIIKNLDKYWWYRYRLVNDFMKIGPGCGESIPAQRRNTKFSWLHESLYWADATIDLGDYITTLVTEYRQLKN